MTPLQSWTSTVAFWSTVAQAPSRVARAQTAATLRMMRAATPWGTGARRLAAVEAAVATSPIEPVADTAPEIIEAAEPAVVAPVEAPAPTPANTAVEAAAPAEQAEALPHDALSHASPQAIAAVTADVVEALPEVEPAPAPVEAEKTETPGLAVLAQPAEETPAGPSLLAMTEESVPMEPTEPALAEAAAAAVHQASAGTQSSRTRPAGGTRARKPRRG